MEQLLALGGGHGVGRFRGEAGGAGRQEELGEIFGDVRALGGRLVRRGARDGPKRARAGRARLRRVRFEDELRQVARIQPVRHVGEARGLFRGGEGPFRGPVARHAIQFFQ